MAYRQALGEEMSKCSYDGVHRAIETDVGASAEYSRQPHPAFVRGSRTFDTEQINPAFSNQATG